MSDPLVAVDALDDLIHNAKPVPLTDQVRLSPEQLAERVDQLRASWPPAAPGHLLDELEVLVRDAPPVPLMASKVRIDKEEVYDLLDRIRAELPAAALRARAASRSGVQHVALEVRQGDTDAEVRFWRMLGFAEVDPPEALRSRSRWVEREGTQVHLLFAEQPVVPPEGHVAVVAADYDPVLETLRRAGVAVDERAEHWGAPRVFVCSPAGHRVEVTARAPGAGA